MFGRIDKIEEMKAKLNSVSPSFCLAKWLHVTLHLNTGHTHSCYLPQTHKIPLAELARSPSALHNTREKKAARQQMLEGKRPSECGICWNIEDLPGTHYSDRHYRGVDDWTMPFFDEVRSRPWDQDINPKYMEVSFSSACNFKCSYCSPAVSTEWMKEIKQKGAYQLSDMRHQHLPWFEENGKLPLDEETNPYLAAFWDWWPNLVPDLLYFRITGGEPLLSRSTFRVLEWLKDNPAPNLKLSVNSNLGVPKKVFERFLELITDLVANGKIHSHILHTSLDTYGPPAEYIRNGLSLPQFEENLERYLATVPKAAVAFMSTFNNLSLTNYQAFLEKVIAWRQRGTPRGQQILLDIPHLQAPHHQSVQILSADYQLRMEALIAFMEAHKDKQFGIREGEIFKMKRILEWMREPLDPEWLKVQRRNFYLFFSEHDRRRGTNFLATFPEMGDFWRHCQELAEPKPSFWSAITLTSP